LAVPSPRAPRDGALSRLPSGRLVLALALHRQGDGFIGFGNYQSIFADPEFQTSLFNNFLWVLVVPAARPSWAHRRPATDRLSWGNIAKSLIFMPMAISFVGASLIWKFVYANDPNVG
jgi:alpha-glucoside transport system permease protein